jgi:hypothetical protein
VAHQAVLVVVEQYEAVVLGRGPIHLQPAKRTKNKGYNVIRDAMEKGLQSLVARWMLAGSADALLDRVAKSGVLSAADLDKLRADTSQYLNKVEAEGAPYAEMALTALKEVAKVVPLASALSDANVRGLAGKVGAVAAQVAAQTMAQAATRAAQVADQLAARQAADSQASAAPPAEPIPRGHVAPADSDLGGEG